MEEPQPQARRELERHGAPRACSRPIIGAVMACVSGALIRAGPMTATVCSMAAPAAP